MWLIGEYLIPDAVCRSRLLFCSGLVVDYMQVQGSCLAPFDWGRAQKMMMEYDVARFLLAKVFGIEHAPERTMHCGFEIGNILKRSRRQ